jgi:pilus assembly protein Flp/PilA
LSGRREIFAAELTRYPNRGSSLSQLSNGVLTMLVRLIKFKLAMQEDRGATAVEYGLIVALIAAVIVGVVATLGTNIADAFTTVDGKF